MMIRRTSARPSPGRTAFAGPARAAALAAAFAATFSAAPSAAQSAAPSGAPSAAQSAAPSGAPSAAAPPVSAPVCGGPAPCPLGDREYHAAAPPDWDGVSPLPVLLHFHGWGRRSAGVLANKRVAAAAAEAGALLVAPQGLGRSWSFWRADSADSDFALAVVEDAARRWPIDRARVFVSGFSYGGAMAWRLACDKGAAAAKFLPIAGSLWRGGEDCAAPVALSHVHGLKDTVMDFPFGPDGEAEGAVSLWLRENQCRAEPDEREQVGRFDCRRWTSCGGPPVELCTHDGGHMIPKGWLAYALPRALAATAPASDPAD